MTYIPERLRAECNSALDELVESMKRNYPPSYGGYVSTRRSSYHDDLSSLQMPLFSRGLSGHGWILDEALNMFNKEGISLINKHKLLKVKLA